MLQVEVRGLDKLVRKLGISLASGPISNAMFLSGLAIQREAQVRAPVDTGRLRADIKPEMDDSQPFPLWVKVGPKVFYGAYVEFGTGIYGPEHRPIRPRRKKALAFTTRSGERVIVAFVRGMRPRPFMRPALPAALPRIRNIWQATFREMVQRWKSG